MAHMAGLSKVCSPLESGQYQEPPGTLKEGYMVSNSGYLRYCRMDGIRRL